MAMDYQSSTGCALVVKPEFSRPSEEGCLDVDLTNILQEAVAKINRQQSEAVGQPYLADLTRQTGIEAQTARS
jgi:hypothetical protein